MVTRDERLQAVRSLGYHKREAEFLMLVAFHSGYFLLSHFRQFIGSARGKADFSFAASVRARGDARVTILGHKTQLFELTGAQLHDALGQPVRRSRKAAPPLIKRRLLSLDFVLAHRGYRFFETEAERVAYFTSELGVDAGRLPRKLWRCPGSTEVTTRYFSDGYPIALLPAAPDEAPQVVFCYVDSGAHAPKRFEAFLEQYRPLVESVGAARVAYVAEHQHTFGMAGRLFERFRAAAQSTGSFTDPEAASLARYFQIRARHEAGAFDRLAAADLQALRSLRDRFAGSRFQDLFERWQRDGDSVIASKMPVDAGAGADRRLALSTWCPERDHDIFGRMWRR